MAPKVTAERRFEADHSALAAPERSRRTLARGVLVFRWVWLVWMIVMAASQPDGFRYPIVAWASAGLATGWTVWLTATRDSWSRMVLWLDIAVCAWLIIASGIVVPTGEIISGRPFFATGYPLSAPLMWGATWGAKGGVAAGLLLGLGHMLSRPLNGVALDELSSAQFQNMTGAVLNYVVAGVAVGLVSRLLVRSAESVQAATDDLMKERERAARLAEREKLARHIHDSVLQALALVHKRGRELAASPQIDALEVQRLAEMAAAQEKELRALIMREPEELPTGLASLREELERAARDVDGIDAVVSSVGSLSLERAIVVELAAAVRQALENVARHARAKRVTVFAEREGDQVIVSVRDDGVGFEYDETWLRKEGKAGILKSMKGRAEDLGGTMTITSGPGSGTEVEFKVPVSA